MLTRYPDCLNLHSRPKAGETEAMLVILKYKPDSRNAQTRFSVDAAMVIPYDELILAPNLASIPEQRKIIEELHKAHGMVGTAICLLMCVTDTAIFRMVPVSFGDQVLMRPRDETWEETLKKDTLTGTMY
jgi:hypothetical protein